MLNSSNIHSVRSAAGRKGAAARWAGVRREPTEKIRVYVSDADRLRAMPGTMAEAVRKILGGKKK